VRSPRAKSAGPERRGTPLKAAPVGRSQSHNRKRAPPSKSSGAADSDRTKTSALLGLLGSLGSLRVTGKSPIPLGRPFGKSARQSMGSLASLSSIANTAVLPLASVASASEQQEQAGGCGVRHTRSGRVSLPRLERWRNERISYRGGEAVLEVPGAGPGASSTAASAVPAKEDADDSRSPSSPKQRKGKKTAKPQEEGDDSRSPSSPKQRKGKKTAKPQEEGDASRSPSPKQRKGKAKPRAVPASSKASQLPDSDPASSPKPQSSPAPASEPARAAKRSKAQVIDSSQESVPVSLWGGLWRETLQAAEQAAADALNDDAPVASRRTRRRAAVAAASKLQEASPPSAVKREGSADSKPRAPKRGRSSDAEPRAAKKMGRSKPQPAKRERSPDSKPQPAKRRRNAQVVYSQDDDEEGGADEETANDDSDFEASRVHARASVKQVARSTASHDPGRDGWSEEEDERLRQAHSAENPSAPRFWIRIAATLQSLSGGEKDNPRDASQCQFRWSELLGRPFGAPADDEAPAQPSAPFQHLSGPVSAAEVGKLGGKGTQKRRRQLRQLMEGDALGEKRQDLLSGSQDMEASTGLDISDLSVGSVKGRAERRVLRSSDASEASFLSPGLLQAPVDREAVDGYVEQLRKRGKAGWRLQDSGGVWEEEDRKGRRRKAHVVEEDAQAKVHKGQAAKQRHRVKAFLSPGGTARVQVVNSDDEEQDEWSDDEEQV
jgi:hypothetical protein